MDAGEETVITPGHEDHTDDSRPVGDSLLHFPAAQLPLHRGSTEQNPLSAASVLEKMPAPGRHRHRVGSILRRNHREHLHRLAGAQVQIGELPRGIARRNKRGVLLFARIQLAALALAGAAALVTSVPQGTALSNGTRVHLHFKAHTYTGTGHHHAPKESALQWTEIPNS